MTASRTLAYLEDDAAKELAASFSNLLVDQVEQTYHRIFPDNPKYAYNTAGPGLSRFSSLRGNYAIIYGAADLGTALYEARIRDSLDLLPSREVSLASLNGFVAVGFCQTGRKALKLIDLSDGRAALQGVPTDVLRWSQHSEGPHFSQFVHDRIPEADGFYYLSRFTEQPCVALFQDRVKTRLKKKVNAFALARSRKVKRALEDLNITVTK